MHVAIVIVSRSTLAHLVAVDEAEETGWKFVHADVFRFPAHPNLFSAAIGSGTQILVMTFVIFGLALVRGSPTFPLVTLFPSCMLMQAAPATLMP